MFLGFIIRRYKDVCLLNIFNAKHLLLSEFQPDSSYWILMLFYALYSVLERKMTILYCVCFFMINSIFSLTLLDGKKST